MEPHPQPETRSFGSDVSVSHTAVGELLAMARETGSLDRGGALLVGVQASLADLLAAATELRVRGKGTVVSFSKKVFIPLTT